MPKYIQQQQKKSDVHYTQPLRDTLAKAEMMSEFDAYEHALEHSVSVVQEIILPAHQHYIRQCDLAYINPDESVRPDTIIQCCITASDNPMQTLLDLQHEISVVKSALIRIVTMSEHPSQITNAVAYRQKYNQAIHVVNTLKKITDNYIENTKN